MLKLQVDVPKSCQLEVYRMSRVREALGLDRGGSAALIAMGQLMGGDYNTGGAKVREAVLHP